MKSLLYLIFIAFLSPTLFGKTCFIDSYNHLISNSKAKSNHSQFIKNSDCPSTIKASFNSVMVDLNGTIDEQTLNTSFQKEFDHTYIKIRPQKIKVTAIEKFLKNNIKISKQDIIFEEIKNLNQSLGFGYDSKSNIQIKCSLCDGPGQKNIKINIRGKNPVWLTSVLKFKVKAIVSLDNISAGRDSLKNNAFKINTVYVTDPEKYVKTIKELSYYKANKGILKGSLIKKSQLTKMNLVEMGRPVSILLDGNGFKIMASGMPMGNGGLYESIKIRNTKTNKVIVGEVYDFNKVKVKL